MPYPTGAPGSARYDEWHELYASYSAWRSVGTLGDDEQRRAYDRRFARYQRKLKLYCDTFHASPSYEATLLAAQYRGEEIR